MNWYRNLKIKGKLLFAFGVVVFLTAVIGISGILISSNIVNRYTYNLDYPVMRETDSLEMEYHFSRIRRVTMSLSDVAGNSDRVSALKSEGEAAYSEFNTFYQNYLTNIDDDSNLTQSDKESRRENMALIRNAVDTYYSTVFQKCATLAENSTASASLSAEFAKIQLDSTETANSAVTALNENADVASDLADEIGIEITAEANTFIVVLAIGLIFTIAVALGIALLCASLVGKPLRALVEAAHSVATGDLNVDLSLELDDEVGELYESFDNVVYNIRRIISDIDIMHKKHDDGIMEAFIDENAYQGAYSEVAFGVNTTVKSYISMLNDVFAALRSIGGGDFNIRLKSYKGQKAIVNNELNDLVQTIRDITKEIGYLAEAGVKGNLSARAEKHRFLGEWAVILEELNNVMNAVGKPAEEIMGVVLELAKGNFKTKMAGNYDGDFNTLKTSMNFTVYTITSYLDEIKDVLSKISEGDLSQRIEREYVGDFIVIKESINKIAVSLNKTMGGIHAASDQVLMGAKQISQSAMLLAEGATEQASSIQELTATAEEINRQAHETAKYAVKANTMSAESRNRAEQGNEEMQQLVEAMNGIKISSNKISNIIEVIEEIATQTNLLALNAAVEAARAGEHGKGFTVVAGSVRDLAVQSQSAAKETSELIQEAISRVNEGTHRATATAQSLSEIVEETAQVSNIIVKISEASQKQAMAVDNISVGLNQISQVVQSNSATSEESAAASEELSSQAEMLKTMVSYFKL